MNPAHELHADGRPRLIGLLDDLDVLGSNMEMGVAYSLADRPCSVCASARTYPPGVSVTLVKRPVAGQSPRLHTLCAAHTEEWQRRGLIR
jgi:hypothetical protein